MHAQNFIIDQGGDWQKIKKHSKLFPQLETIRALAALVESVDAIDRFLLVVAPQQEEIFRVLHFVGE